MTTNYERPEFREVRMDAEIGAYQADPLDSTVVADDRVASSDAVSARRRIGRRPNVHATAFDSADARWNDQVKGIPVCSV